MKYAKEIALGGVLVVLAGAAFYVMQMDAPTAMPPEDQAVAPAAEAEATDINSQFETVLNDFLHSINDKAKAYRDERKVLGELVKPENLREVTYIDQNYEMMKGTISALRLKIEDLMRVFTDTELKVKSLLEGQSPEMSTAVTAEWQKLKDQQAGLYIDFFAIEDEILQGYDDLMTFLYNKKDEFTIDLQNGRFMFADAADDQTVKDLRLRLVELAEKETALLQSHAEKATAP